MPRLCVTDAHVCLYVCVCMFAPPSGVVCVSTWRWLLRESDNPVRVEIEEAVGPYDTWGTEVHTEVKVTAAPKSTATESSSDPWPVLREGDNEGLPVAVLQKALGAAGYHCGDDEGQWWMFGPDTTNALKTFQVGHTHRCRSALCARCA